MPNEFYDPVLQIAGPIAEEYALSISDVMGLLALAGKDERLVRRVLAESASLDEAVAARNAGRPFDLVARARTLLPSSLSERDRHVGHGAPE